MSEDDTERMEGVEFSDIDLGEFSYPITSEELLDRYGDRELGRTNADPITLRELFEYMGEDTFESEEGLQQMILAQMPRESEGRTNYSDRGGSLPTDTEAAEEAADSTSADQEDGEATDRDTKQQ